MRRAGCLPRRAGRPRSRAACAARGHRLGVRASGCAGSPASPRGGLGRPGGGRAMRPSHAGDGPEARDPPLGRLWSLARTHVCRVLDFRLYVHTPVHSLSVRPRSAYNYAFLGHTTPLSVVQRKKPHIQALLVTTITVLITAHS